jgi:hypothetical protein
MTTESYVALRHALLFWTNLASKDQEQRNLGL